ncbi:unnamed protein product [Staurois parvus]|uniref:Uncharacterized protein n=1 Tax=Staurois parvus TaxID=386267 RepID=A0ABN9C2C4_9NEOB|nr:unnamed protein product [Staurois parvus]
MISVAPEVPPVSVHQCQLSVLNSASATSMPHISAYQCTSMPHISVPILAALQCHPSVPISAAYQCASVPLISAS